MRELKFRAWDKKYKKMYEGDIRIALSFPSEDIVIMQFTGRTDKDGQEIYQGDVLEGKEGNYVVEWYTPEAHFRAVRSHAFIPAYQWHKHKCIGNIWQHPELRKAKS